MKKQDFVTAQVTLGADVADAGTFTVAYPAGYNGGDFENAAGHYLSLNGDKLVQGRHLGLSFGATSVTVTNNTGGTLPAHAKGYFQFELAGRQVEAAAIAGVSKRVVPNAKSLDTVLIDFGAPKTLDADGIWDGVTATDSAKAYTVADMATATANGGVLDVPRNLTVTGSAGANHVCTITGRDEYGNTLVESITADGANTVQGVKAFKEVVSIAIAAGAAGDTIDVGWGDVLGLPIAIRSQYDITAEIIDGSRLRKLNDVELIQFQSLETEIDAGTSTWVAPGFAGSVIAMAVAVGDTITTGGTISLEIGGTAVDGLGVVVADASSAGDIDSDEATAGHATAAFTATQALEVVYPAAFNASGRINGTITCRRAAVVHGTLVTALAKNTKPTATNADVRGTYKHTAALDGAISVQLEAMVHDVRDLGQPQYAG